jgi:class 3 adenylate cyclase
VNERRKPEDQILLCVGIGCGRVLRIGDDDVFGAEVNAASKLGEDTAEAGEILVTDSLQRTLAGGSSYRFERIDVVPPGAKAAYRLLYR